MTNNIKEFQVKDEEGKIILKCSEEETVDEFIEAGREHGREFIKEERKYIKE